MVKDRTFIVIGEEHYNPLGVIRSLGENGIEPIYISVKYKSHVASKSKYVKKVHFVDTFEEAYDVLINNYGNNKGEKPFVITTDDDIQSIIDMHYDEIKEKFICFNGGKSGVLTKYMNKMEILNLANKHGLKTLKTWVADRGEIPEDIEYPIITKSISPTIGGWKADVFICEDEKELKEAYTKILSPTVLIQKFIDKKNELCLEGFCAGHGDKMFIPICTTYNYNIKGYYSPYMTVHKFDYEEIGRALNNMLREMSCECIFEIEFLIDQDDEIYFSEINFRNSTWSYAATKLGMPLPLYWAESMESGEIPKEYYKDIPEGYTAMVEPIDHGKRVVEGTTNIADWLMDFYNTDCPYYLSNDDPEPFREMVSRWEILS